MGILLHSYIISIYKQGQPAHRSEAVVTNIVKRMTEKLPELVMIYCYTVILFPYSIYRQGQSVHSIEAVVKNIVKE